MARLIGINHVALEVGDVKTTVFVDAAASQVEVRSSTIKETVDRARVVEFDSLH